MVGLDDVVGDGVPHASPIAHTVPDDPRGYCAAHDEKPHQTGALSLTRLRLLGFGTVWALIVAVEGRRASCAMMNWRSLSIAAKSERA
jgi:hypothetical protein